MGRTSRARKNKCRRSLTFSLDSDVNFINLISWMRGHGWSPSCRLQLANFDRTGRGLKTKASIKPGEQIMSLPRQLLITTSTVAESEIGCLFTGSPQDIHFNSQQVLATFLLWERQLGASSSWEPYLNTLPVTFSTPAFCPPDEVALLPAFLREAVAADQCKVRETLTILRSCLERHSCERCVDRLGTLLNYDMYAWAWYAVNSRCVYLEPGYNPSGNIPLEDANCLALAPFLDLFNHSNEARVTAGLGPDRTTYDVCTTVAFPKHSEVFINYGCHSNVKLCLEYGFVLPANRHDSVPITFDEVMQTMRLVHPEEAPVSHAKYKFLKSHSLTESLSCNEEGLSFYTKALIYVLIATDWQKKSLLQKIYTCDFSAGENKLVCAMSLQLLERKEREFKSILEKMEFKISNGGSMGLRVARDLVRECIGLLNKARFATELSCQPQNDV